MHVSEISFCDNIAFNIKNDDSKRDILEKLEERYNLKIVTKHYDHFAKNSMHTINNNLHMMCTRTNGNPYFLYLVKINYINYCIFIDKKIQQGYFFPRMIITHIFLNDCLFEKDVIFDGEMTKTQDGKWIYLINDLLIYNGTNLSDLNLIKRINLVYKILEDNYKTTDTDIFKIMVKKYFTYDQIDDLVNTFIPSRSYTCRGIYFKPLYLKFRDILVNFDNSLICKVERVKYKNNFITSKDCIIMTKEDRLETESKTTISTSTSTSSSSNDIPNENVKLLEEKQNTFLVKKTCQPDVYELFSMKDTAIKVGTACIQTFSLSKKMKSVFETINMVTKIPIKCEYSEKFAKWVPIFELS